MKRGREGHLDPDVMAEFQAGLIAGRKGLAIAAHLAGCADCAALDDRLAHVSTLLAAVPAPAMPDALARRLDSVLAAESAERTSVHAPIPHRVPAGRPAFRPRRIQLRVLGPAVAGLAVLAGLGFGLTQLGGGSSSSSTASSAAGAAAGGSSAAAVSRPPGQGLLSPQRAAAPAAGNGTSLGALYVVHSNVNYQPATLSQQLTTELAARPFTNPSAEKTATAHSSVAIASVTVRGCALRLSGGKPLLLVESARYRGAPAIVVIASDSKGEQAWIAGANCSGTVSDILARATLPPGISTP